jgi:hypothetical protein
LGWSQTVILLISASQLARITGYQPPILIYETGSGNVTQAGLQLLDSRDPPTSASLVAGTTGRASALSHFYYPHFPEQEAGPEVK